MHPKIIQTRLRLNIETEARDAAPMKEEGTKEQIDGMVRYVNRPDHFVAHEILVTPRALPVGHCRIDARLCAISR